MLPHDLPPWRITFLYFSARRKDGTWERVHEALRERARVAEGRDACPSAAAIDSQSVKTTEKGASGLRRGQAGAGKEAAHRRRRLGTGADGGASGGRAGQGRGEVGVGASDGAFPEVGAHLGRRGVRGQAGAVGGGGLRMALGDSAAAGRPTRVQGAPASVGGGADVRVVGALSAIEQGLRGGAANDGGVGLPSDDQHAPGPLGPSPSFLDTL